MGYHADDAVEQMWLMNGDEQDYDDNSLSENDVVYRRNPNNYKPPTCKKKYAPGKTIGPKSHLSHWVTATGETIQLKDMELSHLENTIKMLNRRGDSDNWLRHLLKEFDRRVME